MKIAWFHSHLLNTNSGGSRYVKDYAIFLAKNGFEIDIYCDQADKSLIKYFKKNRINVIELDALSTYSPIYWLTLPIRVQKKKKKIKKIQNKYDLFISSMFPMNLVLEPYSNKVIQICFEPFAFFYDNEFLKQFNPFHIVFFKLMKFFYSRLDIEATKKNKTIITISANSQKKIKKIYKKKSELVFAGVDSDIYKKISREKINQFQQKYKGSPLLLHTTDYTGTKGTDQLIKIINKLYKDFPHIKLIVTYYLNDKKVLNQMIEKYKRLDFIKIRSAFPYEYLPVVYNSVECVIQPNINRSESWPLREALSAGTSIVGGEISEEATLTSNSLKINVNDHEKSVKNLRTFLNQLKKRNTKKIKSPYDLSINGAKLIKIIYDTKI